jgi:hypothetical protein
MTEVATTDEDAQGMVFDGSSFYISEQKSSDFSGAISFHQLWRKRLSGVPADQMVDDGVDLNGDGTPDNEQMDVIMSVLSDGGAGAKQLGISCVNPEAIVQSVESTSPSAISDQRNRPEGLPFGLVNFRVRTQKADGTAEVTVYLSEPAPEGARWYKYDPINGWVDYSAYATFSADRRSVTLELKDGAYGDLDRIVNGEILDPSGLGTSTGGTTTVISGGGGGGCFISTSASDSSVDPIKLFYLIFAALVFLTCHRGLKLYKRKR